MRHSFVVLAIASVLSGSEAQPLRRVASNANLSQPPALQSITMPSKKSVLLAIAASLILPGMGELYAGNFNTSGKYVLLAEGGIWSTYAGIRLHGTWIRNDARAFATAHSGISMGGKDEQFEVNIGNFLSTDEYNQAKLRNREFDLIYSDPGYNWRWDSDVSRLRFKDQRIRSDHIFQTSKFVIATAVVNRIVSAFSAGRAVGAHNRSLRPVGWGVLLTPGLEPDGSESLALRVSVEF